MLQNNGENLLLGNWKIKIGDIPAVLESFHKEGTFQSEFEGTGHSFSGVYAYDTTHEPYQLDIEVKYSTLSQIPPGIYKSIFKVEGESYTSCTSMPDEERPADFTKNPITAKRVSDL